MLSYDYVGKNDSAFIKVNYLREMVVDTVKPEEYCVKETLTLKANSELSIFYSERLWEEWERLCSQEGYFKEIFLNPKLRHSITQLDDNIVYRDYNKNKTIDHLRYDLTNWEFVEDIDRPKWVMTDSICNLSGYECVMATTDFRGRSWTAFFVPDIPIEEGPWKLCGLPGLIIKAFDSKGHYSYEATEIITTDAGIVEFQKEESRISIKDRRKGLQYRRKCLSEGIARKIQATYGINIKNTGSSPKNYDFEETDYPHED